MCAVRSWRWSCGKVSCPIMNNIISNINTTFIRFNAPISRAKIPTLSVYFLRIFPSTFPWLASPVFDVFYTITQVTPENFRQIISSTSAFVRPFFSALINAGRHPQSHWIDLVALVINSSTIPIWMPPRFPIGSPQQRCRFRIANAYFLLRIISQWPVHLHGKVRKYATGR